MHICSMCKLHTYKYSLTRRHTSTCYMSVHNVALHEHTKNQYKFCVLACVFLGINWISFKSTEAKTSTHTHTKRKQYGTICVCVCVHSRLYLQHNECLTIFGVFKNIRTKQLDLVRERGRARVERDEEEWRRHNNLVPMCFLMSERERDDRQICLYGNWIFFRWILCWALIWPLKYPLQNYLRNRFNISQNTHTCIESKRILVAQKKPNDLLPSNNC